MASEYDDDDEFDDDGIEDDHNDHAHEPLDEFEQTIADSIEAAFRANVNVTQATAHRFEYHIFHAGESFRIGRVANEDIYPLIGEWVGKRHNTIDNRRQLLEKPIHVFMDGKLWSVLEFLTNGHDWASFKETSVTFGLVHEAEVLEHRVLTWSPGEASEGGDH